MNFLKQAQCITDFPCIQMDGPITQQSYLTVPAHYHTLNTVNSDLSLIGISRIWLGLRYFSLCLIISR